MTDHLATEPAAVLWDFDGTLVDTEPHWMAAERELVESYGGAWTDEDGLMLVGNDLMVSAEYIRSRGRVPLPPEEIVQRLLDGVIAQVRMSAPWRPGARELLGELVGLQIPCALVTMSYRRLAQVVIDQLPPGSFDAVVCGDEVRHGKPHPEAYLTAAARLGVGAASCLAIEDSPGGAASAEAAGCLVLVVPSHVPVPDSDRRVHRDTLAGVTVADLAHLHPSPRHPPAVTCAGIHGLSDNGGGTSDRRAAVGWFPPRLCVAMVVIAVTPDSATPRPGEVDRMPSLTQMRGAPMRLTKSLRVPALATAAALAVTLAACGDDDGGGGASGDQVVVGTTDSVTSTDPAGSYDLGSWTLIYNTYQNLLHIPAGESTPEPDAAESCDFEDDSTYVCTLREGLTFHDGSDLTAEDVVFSLERLLAIEDESGGYTLLSNLASIEATDDLTVSMTLTEPDATWPFRLTTGAAAIVPSDVYPADELQPNDEVVGSGPYAMEEYTDGERAVMTPFEDYQGPAELSNEGAIMVYYAQESSLRLAVEDGDVDVAYRSLSPTTVEDLRDAEGLEVVEGNGTEIRYIVFNVNLPPGQQLPARQAMAMLVDRQAIADSVYNGTVDPLYSMIPQGLDYASTAFADAYGETPNPAMAAQTLQAAGVTTPVPVELWWTPSHYGPVSADEYAELERQFEADGLFDITLQSAEWNQYSEALAVDTYAVFQLGWFPDFPDADNYTAPFFLDGGFYNSHYSNPRINELITIERQSTDPAEREAAFAEIQQIAAAEVPTIPIWQGKQIGIVRDGVSGVQDTFDPSFTFRLWMISKPG